MKIFKKIVSMICVFILTIMVTNASVNTKNGLLVSGKADELVTRQRITNQLTDSYQKEDKNIKDIKVTLGNLQYHINVPVLSQSSLNYAYNKHYDLDNGDLLYADNSCSIVASTSIIKYYETDAYEYKYTPTELFIKLYRDSRVKSWTSSGNGTIGTYHDNIVNHGFKNIVGSKNKAENKWYDTTSRIISTLKNKQPLMFTLPNHAVVATGFMDVTITYKTSETTGMLWWKKTTEVSKTKTEKYIEVMNGWGYHSYMRANQISNVFNGNITTNIKVND